LPPPPARQARPRSQRNPRRPCRTFERRFRGYRVRVRSQGPLAAPCAISSHRATTASAFRLSLAHRARPAWPATRALSSGDARAQRAKAALRLRSRRFEITSPGCRDTYHSASRAALAGSGVIVIETPSRSIITPRAAQLGRRPVLAASISAMPAPPTSSMKLSGQGRAALRARSAASSPSMSGTT